jgi:hypothetical protein
MFSGIPTLYSARFSGRYIKLRKNIGVDFQKSRAMFKKKRRGSAALTQRHKTAE